MFGKGEKPGGQMTMHLEKMKIGGSVKVRGPYGHVSNNSYKKETKNY